MNIRILDSAKLDLINGFNFYEAQEAGLGGYFLDSLYSDIDSIIIYAGIHVRKFGEYQYLLSKRFPFAIYYKFKEETVDVHAVLDCRQNPEKISERLG